MTQMRFDGRIALVTGGGSGIGRAHALALAERGCRVAIFDYAVTPLGEVGGADEDGRDRMVAQEILERGGEALGLSCDVTDRDQVVRSVSEVVSHFGRIDIVINNAGSAEVRDPIETTPNPRFERQLDLHLRGSLNVTREVWPHMVSQGYGRVLMTGSATCCGMPHSDGTFPAGYPVAKMALVAATRQYAGAGAPHGINTNIILPWADSRLNSSALGEDAPFSVWMRKNMPASLVATSALYFLHEDCAVSGEMISVGGGRVARIVLAVPRGYFNPAMTPEDVRDHWQEACGAPLDLVYMKSYQTEWELLQNLIG